MIARVTVFSVLRQFRYTLWRTWDEHNPTFMQVIGLNPSTADEMQDDPTVRRCIGYAKRWGYGALCMTNLFAYRSTDPAALYTKLDPVGFMNDHYLMTVAREASLILAGWGTHGNYQSRGQEVTTLMETRPLVCLGVNKDGTPKHPLYLRSDAMPVPYLMGYKHGSTTYRD